MENIEDIIGDLSKTNLTDKEIALAIFKIYASNSCFDNERPEFYVRIYKKIYLQVKSLS